MLEELDNAGKRGPGGRRKNGRTAWQTIVGYLASRGTGAPPYFTLGSGIAQYIEGGAGFRFMAATVKGEKKTSKHRQNRKGRTRLTLHLVWLSQA